MLLEDIKAIKSSKKDLRNFGLTVGIAFGIFGGVLWWFDRSAYPYLVGLGVFLVIGGLLVPKMLLPLQKVWMTFAVIMGFFMTRVILSILFFLGFTPMGLIARLVGKQFLVLKRDPADQSYWNYRERSKYDKSRSEMQF